MSHPCTISIRDSQGNLIPKPNKDISGTSMQSPEDPNATVRTKVGKTHVGSVGNVTETYDDDGNSLITDADIQPNTYSDSDFMKDTIAAKEDPVSEEQVLTDEAYYSSCNAEAAAEKFSNNVYAPSTLPYALPTMGRSTKNS